MIIDALLGVLPKDARQRIEYSKHFAIKDVSKDGSGKNAVVTVSSEHCAYPS